MSAHCSFHLPIILENAVCSMVTRISVGARALGSRETRGSGTKGRKCLGQSAVDCTDGFVSVYMSEIVTLHL